MSGDGNAVVNVYYKRMVFNVTIELNKAGAYIQAGEGGVKYVSGVNNYSFSAKLGQDIRGLFPMDDWVMNSGTQVIDGWDVTNAANSEWWNSAERPHSSVSVYPEFMVPVNVHKGNRDVTMSAAWFAKSGAKYMYRQGYLELTAEERAEYETAVAGGYVTPDYTRAFSYPTAPNNAKDPHLYIRYGTKVYKWYSDYMNEGYAGYNTTEAHYNFWNVPGSTRVAAKLMNNASANWTDSVLYYISDRANYTLTLNPGDGTLDSVENTYTIGYGNGVENAVKLANSGAAIMPEATPNDPTGENLTFAGWYLDSGFEKPLTAETTMPAGNLVLYARYRAGTFNVDFYDKMGGNLLKLDEAYTVYGKGDTVKNPEVYEKGRYYEGLGVFQGWGWFLPNSNNMQPYNYDATVSSDLTLYGLWKTSGFRVTYGANGGSAPIDDNEYKLDVLAVVQGGEGLAPPAGEIFIGWQVDGAGAIYYPGTNVRILGNVKLVAKYVPEGTVLIPIHYHPNYNGSTEPTQTVNALPNSETTTLGAAAFARAGYVLGGWTTEEGGQTVKYNFGEALQVLEAPIDLYAVWQKDPAYTVTFKVANGQEAFGTLSTAAEQDKSGIVYADVPANSAYSELEWPAATPNQGYYFVGWTPANPVGMYVTADQTYEAKFAKIDFVVADKTKFYGEPDAISLQNLFSYWPSGVPTSHFDINFERVAGEDVGAHAINVTVEPKAQYAEKYNLAPVNSGMLTIKKLPVTIAPNGNSKPHGEKDPTLTATVDYGNASGQAPGDADPASFASRVTVGGLTGGDTAAMLNVRVTRAAGEDTGSYAYNVEWDDSNNYREIRLGHVGSYTITPRTVVLVANSYTVPEGNEIPAPTAYVHSEYPLVNGDTTLNYSLYRNSSRTTAGTYDILFNVGTNPNYNVNAVPGMLTITADDAPVAPPAAGAGPAAPLVAAPVAPVAPLAGTPQTQEVTPDQTPVAQPPVQLQDGDTPLGAAPAHWALLNLIIAVLALLLAVVLLVGVFSRRRKEEAEEQENDEAKENKGRTGLLWRVLAIIAGIAAPIVFFFTENLRHQMTFVDNWTLLMVILLAVQAVLMLILYKARQPKDQDDEQDHTPAQA